VLEALVQSPKDVEDEDPVFNEVDGEVHGADIVVVDKSAPRRQALELMEQLLQPSGLSHTIGDGTVHSLRAATEDDGLPFGQPGHQVGPRNTA
jgi:hypothetical protein